ncbi:MAG TPA: ferredoxin family protein [Anaerolineae bacterium]|nr:ferredoxin family protein [Anaerolineae bacterium]HPL27716.1 ferredoxin family protein [Anaerolineae bacterium]
MYIRTEICNNCASCIPTCPVGAIYVDRARKHVTIDQELCVECGACYRAGVCKTKALTQPQLTWPRSVRAALSDPVTVNADTRIAGRGTEEMKTNDVTGRFLRGYVGIALELGRPCLGASFADVQVMSRVCAQHGAEFCANNPVTKLLTDTTTGDVNSEVLNERVLSAIVEVTVPLERVPELLTAVIEAASTLKTVCSIDAVSLVEPDGSIPLRAVLAKLGLHPAPNGKNNMGLGRPAFDFFGGDAL